MPTFRLSTKGWAACSAELSPIDSLAWIASGQMTCNWAKMVTLTYFHRWLGGGSFLSNLRLMVCS